MSSYLGQCLFFFRIIVVEIRGCNLGEFVRPGLTLHMGNCYSVSSLLIPPHSTSFFFLLGGQLAARFDVDLLDHLYCLRVMANLNCSFCFLVLLAAVLLLWFLVLIFITPYYHHHHCFCCCCSAATSYFYYQASLTEVVLYDLKHFDPLQVKLLVASKNRPSYVQDFK